MIKRTLLLICTLFVASSTQAAWDLGGGLESYQWQEYPQGNTGIPNDPARVPHSLPTGRRKGLVLSSRGMPRFTAERSITTPM